MNYILLAVRKNGCYKQHSKVFVFDNLEEALRKYDEVHSEFECEKDEHVYRCIDLIDYSAYKSVKKYNKGDYIYTTFEEDEEV